MFLTDLFMNVGSDYSWLDERTDLDSLVGTIMINVHAMIEHKRSVLRRQSRDSNRNMLSGNHKITKLNSDVTTTILGCCIESGFACSNMSICQLTNKSINMSIFPCRFAKLDSP